MTNAALREGQAELPSVKSTDSYWHREASKKLLGHRSTEELPASADVVIIGSGIAGAFAARHLHGSGKNVVMLEAREACWGATGRNGGHCQPFIYCNKPHLGRFELATYHYLRDLVDKNNIPCAWRTVGGVHAIGSQERVDLVATYLGYLRREHPELAEGIRFVTEKDELARLRIPGVAGAVVQPNAARVWPYKLISWVLEDLLSHEDGTFNLQTNTPATALQRFESSWIVHTPRGQISAPHVLLATNAYTSRLLPNMSGIIVPVRGHVLSLLPPDGGRQLEHSYGWATEQNSDDYLIHRDADDGSDDGKGGPLIFGGQRLSVPDAGIGVSRDDEIDPIVARNLRRGLHSAVKLKPSGEEAEELSASHQWSGIMGFSSDDFPWVGKATRRIAGGDADGLWLCAGFTGHGMPVAARCAMAAADMILGREAGIELPEEYRISDERLDAAEAIKGVNLRRKLTETTLEFLKAAVAAMPQS